MEVTCTQTHKVLLLTLNMSLFKYTLRTHYITKMRIVYMTYSLKGSESKKLQPNLYA